MIRVLIPARGGSKRIPNKNLLKVDGHSLVGRAIMVGKKITDNVWVSTDSDKIKLESFKYNSYIHNRKNEHATDHSPTIDTILDFLSEYKDTTTLVLLQCTTPFTNYEDVLRGIREVQSGEYNSAVSVFGERCFYWSGDNQPQYDTKNRTRTQDMNPYYKETGGFYVINVSEFLKNPIVTTEPTKLIDVSLKSSFDIDTFEEYELIKEMK